MSYEVIVKASKVLAQIALPESRPLPSYGTAGFRCLATNLEGIATRLGVLGAVRSLTKAGDFVGVVITASHNPAPDNGMKLIDPDGGMLEQDWEPLVVKFIHSCSEEVEIENWLTNALADCNANVFPRVLVGFDTRASSPSLAREVVDGVELMGGICIQLGLVSTPQVHFCVHHLNQMPVSTSGDVPTLDLDRIYVQHFANCFKSGLGNLGVHPIINLHIDCAHGVGSLVLSRLAPFLSTEERVGLRLRLYNTEVLKHDLLNQNCGADYVKITQSAPKLYQTDSMDYSSPTDHWASLDGDADRLIYFMHNQPTSVNNRTSSVTLLDGDRIACLFARFLTKLLHELHSPLSMGVVQTAYANAGSTLYLKHELGVTVVCVPTGVKHVHRAAQKFDFGIYFEANGHGTVLFSTKALDFLRSLDRKHPLVVFQSLTNTTIGDAITDLLMVEYALAWHKWTLVDWAQMYTELASRQIKVAVDNPALIQTMDSERRISSPTSLQTAIDNFVDIVNKGTNCKGKSRAFVRPSGTEQISRVYAESINQVWADWLAGSIAVATHQLANGIGPAPAEPGPLP